MKEPHLLQGYKTPLTPIPNLSLRNGMWTMECVSQPGPHVEWWAIPLVSSGYKKINQL
jgi:hypothetical protein